MTWSDWWQTYSTLVLSLGVWAMMALSIAVTLSCGLLSLANAAFMGIGAYVSAIATTQFGWGLGAALTLGVAAASLAALLIGIPVLRLSGVYLAMATLGFGEVLRVILLNLDVTGGPLGLNDIPPLTQGWHVAVALISVAGVLALMRRSKYGRACEALREDELAAQTMGVNTAPLKLVAMVAGAAIAGWAGGLNAHYTFTLGPSNFGFETAVDVLTMAVLGGTRGVMGPILGGMILTLLPELLRGLQDFRLAANGLVLILVVLFLPQGIWPGRSRSKRQHD